MSTLPRNPLPEPRFALSDDDRLRHVLVVGKTGMGKSTLLRRLCLHDAELDRGFCLLDPHGDLAADVLRDLPRRRTNDLVVFDAARPEACPGLNPLRAVAPALRPLVASNVLATMRKIWPEFWGPRTDHILRNVLLALMEVRGATLGDARSLLVDEAQRQSFLKQVKDARVLEFWGREFPGYGKAFAAEVTAPVLNKLGGLLSSEACYSILTKRRPIFDARRAMDQGRVVVASLPKGQMGEDAALVLGGLLLSALQHAALARADVEAAKRRNFFVVVDEVGSFATGPFLGLVAEARKYGLGLVLAAQSLAAMDLSVRLALLGNVGTLVAFRLGADDADIVARELVNEYRAEHLMRLRMHEMVVRVGAARPVVISPPAV